MQTGAVSAARALSGKRVLIVEDERDARELLEMVLLAAGAEVATAASGAAALQHMQQAPFNLVVSDIGLPEMDGYQLAGELRNVAQKYGSQPRMVAFTAFSGARNRQLALDAGFDAHIGKPIDPVALVSLVERLLTLA